MEQDFNAKPMNSNLSRHGDQQASPSASLIQNLENSFDLQTAGREADMRIFENEAGAADTLQSFGGQLTATNPYKRQTNLLSSYIRDAGTEETKSVEEDETNFRIDPAVSQRMSRYCEATQQTESSNPMG